MSEPRAVGSDWERDVETVRETIEAHHVRIYKDEGRGGFRLPHDDQACEVDDGLLALESLLHEHAALREERDRLAAERDGREWLCDKCNMVYPASSLRFGVMCIVCPDEDCQGDIAPRASTELRRALAANQRLREALADCLRHLDFEAADDDQYAEGARNVARAALAETTEPTT